MSSQCSCCYLWCFFLLIHDRERHVTHPTSPLQSCHPCIGFWHSCACSRAVVPETMCCNISKGIFPPYLSVAICLYAVFSDGPFYYTYSNVIGYEYPDCILFALGGKSKQTSCSWTQTLRDGETRIGKVYLMTPYSLTDYRLINLSGFLVDFFEIIVPPPPCL